MASVEGQMSAIDTAAPSFALIRADPATSTWRKSRICASAEAVIARHDDWRSRAGPEVGTVDLDGYARWLYEELGWGAAPGSAEL